ncbi:uncharacterized protein LOC110706781 [Chenopodium quinoa]|uniref:uncharacterized protein LOC110706781 n=1 Tax=Chenopodium quinoa TaxID=63459 RepID=UPI000B779D14|nr:uncharacterized protein LOC110706781 [Chenopodium quinoa]
MNDDNNRTPEALSEESDSEFEDGGDGVNYSANFVTGTFFPMFDDPVKWADAVAINLGFILIYYEFITDSWKIRAKNDATGTHNHPMIVYQEGHHKISGLSPDAKKVVHDMKKSKVAPRNIMATIAEQFPDDHSNIRHIYNCRNDLRTKMSDGKGVVQQFLNLARHSQYIYWVMSDDLGVLHYAFMVHPITRLRELIGYDKEPSVFLTNRELGLCAALRKVFPGTSHLLCRWHINKDKESRVTDMFKNKRIGATFKNGKWKRIMDAATEADYNAAVDTMKARWASYPTVISYVEKTWLCHKTKFVTFWTNQVLHLGNTSTCGVESQHSAVKMWFESSTGFGEKYRQLPLSRINGKVSQHCLKVLDDETRRMRELSYQVYVHCGCAMRVTHGFPCACQIHDLLVAQTSFYIKISHPFWKTLVIGDGVDVPVFVNDSTEETAHFRSLVDEVIGSDPAIL